MIFVCAGSLTYTPIVSASTTGRRDRDKENRSNDKRRTTARRSFIPTANMGTALHPGDWISDAVLWTHWMHRGILTATSDCRLCLLDSERFGATASAFDHDEFNPKRYAAEFVRRLNMQQDISDVQKRLAG